MFSDSLKNDNGPLVSYYGAVAGLQELGPEVIKVFILPHIKFISHRYVIARVLMEYQILKKQQPRHN